MTSSNPTPSRFPLLERTVNGLALIALGLLAAAWVSREVTDWRTLAQPAQARLEQVREQWPDRAQRLMPLLPSGSEVTPAQLQALLEQVATQPGSASVDEALRPLVGDGAMHLRSVSEIRLALYATQFEYQFVLSEFQRDYQSFRHETAWTTRLERLLHQVKARFP